MVTAISGLRDVVFLLVQGKHLKPISANNCKIADVMKQLQQLGHIWSPSPNKDMDALEQVTQYGRCAQQEGQLSDPSTEIESNERFLTKEMYTKGDIMEDYELLDHNLVG